MVCLALDDMLESQKVIAEHFVPQMKHALPAFVARERDNRHVAFALSRLAAPHADFEELFEYGIDQLERSHEALNMKHLSAYFFLLSEIKALPSQARDFALNVSVHLEDPELSPLARGTDIRAQYQASVAAQLNGQNV